MPLFDYKCETCGYTWEELSPRVQDLPPKALECPKCGDKAGKLPPVSNFVLKGDWS